MSDVAVPFLDLLVRGEAHLDEIDDYVDRWHAGVTKQDLAAYLGKTHEEYCDWLVRPDVLSTIAQARRARHAAVS